MPLAWINGTAPRLLHQWNPAAHAHLGVKSGTEAFVAPMGPRIKLCGEGGLQRAVRYWRKQLRSHPSVSPARSRGGTSHACCPY